MIRFDPAGTLVDVITAIPPSPERVALYRGRTVRDELVLIGAFARAARLSVKALRHHHRTVTVAGTAVVAPGFDHAVAAAISQLLERAADLSVANVTLPVVGKLPVSLGGRLAGGRFLRRIHAGPHETLPLTCRGLLVAAGPPASNAATLRARYLDDPASTGADVLRTEVLLPLDP